jgi:hypothetical protein
MLALAIIGTGAGMLYLALPPQPTPTASPTVSPTPLWHAIAPSPLSPRHAAHAFWTGSEVLVIGGDAAVPPCPGECFWTTRILRDGAAYDPRRDQWRSIRPAPVPLENVAGALLSDALYLLVWSTPQDESIPEMEAFLRYRIADDRWDELPLPHRPVGAHRLVSTGSRIVAYFGTQENGFVPDQAYDPKNGVWTDLPRDPLAPAFDRSMVWTGQELVALAVRIDPARAPNEPPLYSAAVLDATWTLWRRLQDSQISGWDPRWYWSGGRIVNATFGSADGGQTNNWGRFYPFGGLLEPSTGSWSPLPAPPTEQGEYRGLSVAGAQHVVSSGGWVLEVSTGRWTPIPRPFSRDTQGEAVVWAGDRLMVWGGIEWDTSRAQVLEYRSTLLASGWTWRP